MAKDKHDKTVEQTRGPAQGPTHGKGEGDYESAERYNEATKRFAESGPVEEKADEAKRALEDEEQAKELEAAEEEGRSKSKGEDRLLHEEE